jgi:hypothetical protein
VIDNFLSAIKRMDIELYKQNIIDRKPIGYVIAFTFSRGAVEEVARLDNSENIIIKLVRVDEIVKIATKPTLKVEIQEINKDEFGFCEIEFVAKGFSDYGIEFYSWDFDYNEQQGFNAEIMIDRAGKQIKKLSTGTYNIAVKVVDNDGLESLEVVKLKVNGVVLKMTNDK